MASQPTLGGRYDETAEFKQSLDNVDRKMAEIDLLNETIARAEAAADERQMDALRKVDPQGALYLDATVFAREIMGQMYPDDFISRMNVPNNPVYKRYEAFMREKYPTIKTDDALQSISEQVTLYRRAAATLNGADKTGLYSHSKEAAERFDNAMREVVESPVFKRYRIDQRDPASERAGKAFGRGVEDIGRNLLYPFQDEATQRNMELQESAQMGRDIIDPVTYPDSGLLERGAIGAARSAPFTIGGIGAALAGGGPTAFAFTLSQTAPEAYREYRRSGFSEAGAATAATITGTIEAWLERIIPFERLAGLKGGTATGLKDAVAKTLKEYVVVTGGETAEELLQGISRSATRALAEHGVADAMRDIGAELPSTEQIAETVITSGILTGPGRMVNLMAMDYRRKNPDKRMPEQPSRREFEEATGIRGDAEERQAFAAEVNAQIDGKPPFEVSPEDQAAADAGVVVTEEQRAAQAEADRAAIDAGQQAPAEVVQSAQPEQTNESPATPPVVEATTPTEMNEDEAYEFAAKHGLGKLVDNLGVVRQAHELRTSVRAIQQGGGGQSWRGVVKFDAEPSSELVAAIGEQLNATWRREGDAITFETNTRGAYESSVARIQNLVNAGYELSKRAATPPAVAGATPTEAANEAEVKAEAQGQGQEESLLEQPEQGAVETPPPPTGDAAYIPKGGAPTGLSLDMPPEETIKYAKPISNQQIIEYLAQTFDLPIRFGRVANKRAAGIYKSFAKVAPQVIRLVGDFAGHIGVASHEIAHHIDRIKTIRKSMPLKVKAELRGLDYDPTKARVHEGWAEFIRMYLTRDDSIKAAPLTTAWLEQTWLPNNPEIGPKLRTARRYMDQWRMQGALNRGRANLRDSLSPTKPPEQPFYEYMADRARGFLRRMHVYLFNQNIAANDLAKFRKAQGKKDDPGETLYEMMKAFTSTVPGHAYSAMEEGVHSVAKNNFLTRIGPSLADALKLVGKAKFNDFGLYLWARRANELWKRNIQTGLTREDSEFIERELAKENPQFQAAAEKFTEYNNALLEMATEAGVITVEEKDEYVRTHEKYAPLMAVPREGDLSKHGISGKMISNAKLVKRMRGADTQRLHPVMAAIQRTLDFYRRAVQQQMVNELVREVSTVEGGGRFAEAVPPGTQTTTATGTEVVKQLVDQGVVDQLDVDEAAAESAIINIFRPNYMTHEGRPVQRVMVPEYDAAGDVIAVKPKLYHFDPDMLELIGAMDAQTVPIFLEMTIGKAALLFKTGATTLNPTFAVKNIIRDFGSYLAQTDQSWLSPETFVGPARAVGLYLKTRAAHLRGQAGDPSIELYMKMGGDSITLAGLQAPRQQRRVVSEITAQSTGQRAKLLATDPIETLKELVNFSEIGPRVAEFRSVLKNRGYGDSVLKSGVVPPRNVLIEAMNRAKDVTIDFTQGGKASKPVNRLTAQYLNAYLQGMYVIGQTFKNHPVRTMLRLAAAMTLMLPYIALKRREDWYKEAAAWLKYATWTFADMDGKPIVRIPRAEGWGLFIGMFEASVNSMLDGNAEEMGKFADFAEDRLNPGLSIPIVSPSIEVATNYDFFRDRPIVSDALKRLETSDQVKFDTTEFAKSVGGFLDIAPAKIQHWLDAVTGGMFKAAATPIEKVRKGELPFTPTENPVFNALSLKQDYTTSENEFYEHREKVSQSVNSAKKRGAIDPAMVTEQKRIEYHADAIAAIRKLADPAEPDRDKRFEFDKYETGLARAALGKEPLDRYPTPATVPGSKEVQAAFDEVVLRAAKTASQSPPRPTLDGGYKKKLMDYQTATGAASRFLVDLGIKPSYAARLMIRDAAKDGRNIKMDQQLNLYSRLKKAQ